MAAKTMQPGPGNAVPAEQPQALQEIGVLRRKHCISRAAFAGICAVNGWKTGRTMSDADFLRAVSAFMESPVGASCKKGG